LDRQASEKVPESETPSKDLPSSSAGDDSSLSAYVSDASIGTLSPGHTPTAPPLV
jgi:hypothetical protein